MKSPKKLFLVLFTAVAVVELSSYVVTIEVLHHIAKPMLMLALTGYFVSSTKRKETPSYVVIIAALSFSWLGDVFLMYQNNAPIYFMLGLGAFLVSHVFYIISYRKTREKEAAATISKPRLARYNFFLTLICVALLTVLTPHLGDLLIPVYAYSAVVTAMAMAALGRYGKTAPISFWLVTGGALLFMFSDSTIAINKFIEPVPQAGFIIMLTYIIAQFLIIEGLIRHSPAANS